MANAQFLWDDGRSGKIGKFSGNLALREVAGSETALFKEKGTIFASTETIYVGRVATENYLTGGNVHWANVSWDQHTALTRQARKEKKHLRYLFITAAEPAEVRIWVVPGSVVEASIRHRGKDRPGGVMAVHIVAEGGRYVLGSQDVTAYFTLARLDPTEAMQLRKLLAEAALQRASSPAGEAGSHKIPNAPLSRSAADRSTCFDIPVTGGRSARLSVPLPLTPGDVSRIKGWIDLMSDVLIEDPIAASEQAKQAQRDWLRAQLQAGLHQLENGEGIDGETAITRILDRSTAIAAAQE